jgi:hypothetical protein
MNLASVRLSKSPTGFIAASTAALVSLCSLIAHAQIVPANPPAHSPIASRSVAYLFPEQVSIPAGKSSPVTLHFHVASGLHINSHTPSSSFLIPTTLSVPPGSGVTLEDAAYPAGTVITLPVDPSTRLSVYTGDFAIHARLVAAPGEHLVQARLHYQACNDSECFPPKTITAAIDVIGK